MAVLQPCELIAVHAEALHELTFAWGLHRPEGHALAPRGIDHADTRYLEDEHDQLVATQSKPAHTPFALAGLGDVAPVDNYGKLVGQVGEHLSCKVGVVGDPIDILREVVAVCLLAICVVFPHQSEIDIPH